MPVTFSASAIDNNLAFGVSAANKEMLAMNIAKNNIMIKFIKTCFFITPLFFMNIFSDGHNDIFILNHHGQIEATTFTLQ